MKGPKRHENGNSRIKIQDIYSEIIENEKKFTPISVEQLNFQSLNQEYKIHPQAEYAYRDALQIAEDEQVIPFDFENVKDMIHALAAQGFYNNLVNSGALMFLLFFIDDTIGRKNSEKIFNEEITPKMVIEGMIYFIKEGELRTQYVTESGELKQYSPTKIELAFARIWKSISTDLGRKVAYREWTIKDLEKYVQRLIDSARDYLPQNVNVDDQIMSLDEYLEYRINNSGMRFTIDLMEYTTDTYIEEFLDRNSGISTELEGMRYYMSLVGSLTNDLFSFPKELYGGETKTLNLIPVMMHEYGYSFEKAVNVAIKLVNKCIEQYLQYRLRLLDKLQYMEDEDERKRLLKYISILDDIGIATYRWQLEGTYRYRHFYHIFKEMRFKEGTEYGDILPEIYDEDDLFKIEVES